MKVSIISQSQPNLAWDVEGAGTANSTKLLLWDYHGQTNQQFVINDDSTILSLHSDKVLDISGGEDHGRPIIIFQPTGGNNQKWFLHSDGTIRSINGFAIDVEENELKRGAHLVSWPVTGSRTQKWRIITHT